MREGGKTAPAHARARAPKFRMNLVGKVTGECVTRGGEPDWLRHTVATCQPMTFRARTSATLLSLEIISQELHFSFSSVFYSLWFKQIQEMKIILLTSTIFYYKRL